ncbi:hypothetical protein EU545_04610 [Candidatus Thorarchaeota archaeon]|nr:MAG: hypothetical protein EU545_04610 [Candidatus Thorarchaeota archaeon]
MKRKGVRTMLVVEDLKTREIYRFLVVDGCMQLGVVSLNSHEKTFGPDRALGYVSRVQGQLLNLVSRYKHSYRYVPRLAYEHLKRPPFLDSLSGGPAGARDTEWFVDQFVVKPLLSIGGLDLTQKNQEKSSRLLTGITESNQHSGRFFRIQETKGAKTPEGFTVVVRADEIAQVMQGRHRNSILRIVKRGGPVLFQLDEPEEMDEILKWLILLKDSDVETPAVILHVLDHRKWPSQRLEMLADIPSARILTAGATIVSLSSLIGALRRRLGHRWSQRLIFGTNYPETNLGDGIPEILSYILSKNLDASPIDVQRILAGNMLSLLPLRPPYLKYQDRSDGVVAEGRLGRPAKQELIRVLQTLTASRDYSLESFHYSYDAATGTIDTSMYILTLLDEQSRRGTTIVIRDSPNGSLEICTWNPKFDATEMAKNPSNLRALLRSFSTTSALVLDSPIHLNSYVEALTKCLNVRRPQELLAALRYRLEVGPIPRGHLQLAHKSVGALGKAAADMMMAMSQGKGQWWVAKSIPSAEIDPTTAIVSDEDRRCLGLDSGEAVDLTGYQETVTKAERVLFVTRSQEDLDAGETYSYRHLHSTQIEDAVRPLLLGRGSKVYPFPDRQNLSLELIRTHPMVQTGEVADLTEAEVVVRQPEFLQDIDIIVCIALTKQMVVKDMELASKYSLARKMRGIIDDNAVFSDRLDIMDSSHSRLQVAVMSALFILEALEENRSEGRLGLCIAGERLRKFSIQHGEEIQDFVDFDRDLESPEVRTALNLFILDALHEEKSEQATVNSYRAINEYVDDFGISRPTLAILIGDFSDEIDDSVVPFIDALPTESCFGLLRLRTCSSSEPTEIRNGEVVNLNALSVQGLIGELARALRRVNRGQSVSR